MPNTKARVLWPMKAIFDRWRKGVYLKASGFYLDLSKRDWKELGLVALRAKEGNAWSWWWGRCLDHTSIYMRQNVRASLINWEKENSKKWKAISNNEKDILKWGQRIIKIKWGGYWWWVESFGLHEELSCSSSR